MPCVPKGVHDFRHFFFLTFFWLSQIPKKNLITFGDLKMKKIATSIVVLFLFFNGYSQKDSVEVLFAYRITDYTVKLNDSVTIVQITLQDALPVSIKDKAIGILKHRYESGNIDTNLIGWGRCNLIKGDYYYFTIHKYSSEEPEQGDLLYTKCKTLPYYKSLLFDINTHAINLTTVYEDQFYHASELFQLNAQKEKALLDSMVADIRLTGTEMKKQMPGQNQLVKGGLFDGKKIFEAMETTSRKELEEFLKYVIARPVNYAGNTWKLSEIFATWAINKSPQVIAN